jgi:hypothetical protein
MIKLKIYETMTNLYNVRLNVKKSIDPEKTFFLKAEPCLGIQGKLSKEK